MILADTAVPGNSMLEVLASAFARGWRQRSDVVGTGYVLRALVKRLRLSSGNAELKPLLEADWTWDAFPSERSILHAVGESRLDIETSGLLNESVWLARRRMRLPAETEAPVWSADVAGVVEQALLDAAAVNVTYANAGHLLVALLARSNCQAGHYLRQAGVPVRRLLDEAHVEERIRTSDVPLCPAVMDLAILGLVESSIPVMVSSTLDVARRIRWPDRSGAIYVLCQEAVRQAVRLGSLEVSTVHLLVAICSIEVQLKLEKRRFTKRLAGHNDAGQFLANWNVDYRSLADRVSTVSVPKESSEVGRRWRMSPSDPRMGFSAVSAMRDAQTSARTQGRRRAGTRDVLVTLLQATDGPVTKVLTASGVDLEQMTAQLSSRV